MLLVGVPGAGLGPALSINMLGTQPARYSPEGRPR